MLQVRFYGHNKTTSGMARRGMDITLAGYKWEVVGGTISRGYACWGSGCAGGRCAFPLVVLLCLQKWKFGGLSGDAIEIRVKVVERGFPSYKCARVHNNFKSEDLILKLKL